MVDRGIVESCVAGRVADRSADQSACDVTALLGDLVGIRDMSLSVMPQPRRVQGQLPCLNKCSIHGDRVVNAGLPDVGVVKEIVHTVLKGVGVEQPAFEGNLHAKLALFIAFAVERLEACIVGVRVIHHGAGCGEQWRGLIVASVEGAKYPVQLRYLDCDASSRIGVVLRNAGREIRLAQAGNQGQPGCGFVVVGDVFLNKSPSGRVGNAEIVETTVIKDGAEEVAIVLAPAVDSSLDRVACNIGVDVRLQSGVVGGAVGGRRDGEVI